MRQATNTYSLKNKKPVNLAQVLLLFLSLIIISGYIFYQLIPKKDDNFTFFSNQTKTVYLLLSKENESYLNKINLSIDAYEDSIQELKKKFALIKVNAKIINEDDISSLKKDDILIAFNIYSISSDTLQKIKKFLNRGGNFIFNYHFAYFIDDQFVKAKTIESLTGLKYFSESLPKNQSECNFFVPKILSPLTLGNNGKREDLVMYSNDTLPLFYSKNIPDAILTNWEITSTPILNNTIIPINYAGVIWHGFYGKGRWFYFSFPSYVFLDMPINTFKKFFNNIFNYLNNIVIAKYPFLYSKNAVFISEDTEYKYTNMINFAALGQKYHIPVTLFCVAKLALQHPQLTKQASEFPYVEIGSHSYSHTKILGQPLKKVIMEIEGSKEILEKIIGKKIYGFRPPREEIDKPMENELRKAGYKYVMEKTKPYLLPEFEYDNLVTLPRHGTDDYIYLINLDWNKTQILHKIIQETNMLTSLNALYTLSVHTHLLSYKSNLSVTKHYFDYLTAHKNIHPYKGIELANITKWKKNIIITTQKFNKNIFIFIINENNINIKNFTFRIYWANKNGINILPEMTNVKIKIIENNKERKFTDVRILDLKPNSKISLIMSADD